MIRDARDGDRQARERFTSRYLDAARGYLIARWGGTPLAAEVDDAVQDVFVDCFKEGGVLERVEPARTSGFRAFFFGVVRTVALHTETRRARELEQRGVDSFHPDRLAAREETLSRTFDRAWARAVLREAAELQAARAREKGGDAPRLVDLLRLRFHDGLPIREIAQRWDADPARLHHEYARARREFAEALREVVGAHEKCTPEQLDAECGRLLEHLRKK